MRRSLTADELINEIAETLRQGDGEFIESIANQVLVPEVSYLEDSMFEQDTADEEEQTRRDEKNGLYPDKEDIAN